MPKDNPNLKEFYSKKHKNIQSYADGGEVIPEGAIPEHKFIAPNGSSPEVGPLIAGNPAPSNEPGVFQTALNHVDQNLQNYDNTVTQAMLGNPIAQQTLSQNSIGMATMGSIKAPPIAMEYAAPVEGLLPVSESGFVSKAAEAQKLLNSSLENQDQLIAAGQRVGRELSHAPAIPKGSFRPKRLFQGGLNMYDGGEVPEGAIPENQFNIGAKNQPIVDINGTQSNRMSANTKLTQLGTIGSNSNIPEGAVPEDEFQTFDEKFGSPAEIGKTAIEGAAEGIAGPVGTAALRALGDTAGGMRSREEANPIVHGAGNIAGFAGSMMMGTGLGSAAAHIGEAAVGVARLADAASISQKIAQGATRAAAEMGLLEASNEVSKVIKEDPETSIQSAMVNVGLSGLMGAVGGGALASVSPLWKASMGGKMGQLVEDFKGRLASRAADADPISSLTDELTAHHKLMRDSADEVYGTSGLKSQAIAEHLPEMHEGISEQVETVAHKMEDSIEKMRENPAAFPERLVQRIERDSMDYASKISNDSSPHVIFDAAQDLKQSLQSYAKYEKFIKPTDEAYDFVKEIKGLANTVKESLEDKKVWGKAAEIQSETNKAFSRYLPALKDFEKKFTTEIAGENQVDPGKIQTYLNQLDKPNGDIKKEMLSNFLDSSDKYKDAIDKLYSNLGVESPIKPSSLSASRESLKELTTGAKLADIFIKNGLKEGGSEGIATAIGAGVGHKIGGASGIPGSGILGAYIGSNVLGPFFKKILPALLKPILEKEASGVGLKAATDYINEVVRADSLINKAAKNLFKSNAEVIPTKLLPDHKSIVKLDKILQDAHALEDHVEKDSPDHIGHYLPEHSTALTQTAAVASQYLNSIRPSVEKKSPLDSNNVVSKPKQAEWESALKIAQQPLLVLDKIKMGTITPIDIKHLKAIAPALYNKIASELSNSMQDHISDGESIPYKTRIGLSLFLGQGMDSTLTPMGIAGAQPGASSSQSEGGQQSSTKGRAKPAKVDPQKISASSMTPLQRSESHSQQKD